MNWWKQPVYQSNFKKVKWIRSAYRTDMHPNHMWLFIFIIWSWLIRMWMTWLSLVLHLTCTAIHICFFKEAAFVWYSSSDSAGRFLFPNQDRHARHRWYMPLLFPLLSPSHTPWQDLRQWHWTTYSRYHAYSDFVSSHSLASAASLCIPAGHHSAS